MLELLRAGLHLGDVKHEYRFHLFEDVELYEAARYARDLFERSLASLAFWRHFRRVYSWLGAQSFILPDDAF